MMYNQPAVIENQKIHIKIFDNAEEAAQYAQNTKGMVIKESGENIWYVFPARKDVFDVIFFNE